MQAGLFAKKVGMTQILDESGTIYPVTILKAGLCKVSQIKTIETDGYNAIQLAYGQKTLASLNKPTQGHLKKVGNEGFTSFGENLSSGVYVVQLIVDGEQKNTLRILKQE